MPVYLIHLDRPLGHAQHYLGFAQDERCLDARIACHRRGGSHAAKLMAAVKRAGISWRVTRVWPGGTRDFERSLKQGSHKRKCPECGGWWGRKMPSLIGDDLKRYLARIRR